uniref:Uncharacterized protein n=1 Tax=Nothobranchius korthausae TaxID=1143690 RepID=A0A1A8F0T8_9TELE
MFYGQTEPTDSQSGDGDHSETEGFGGSVFTAGGRVPKGRDAGSAEGQEERYKEVHGRADSAECGQSERREPEAGSSGSESHPYLSFSLLRVILVTCYITLFCLDSLL